MTVGGTRQILMRESRPMSGAPDTEAVIEQLERIFASGDFDASPRSRAFIRFILDETLAGRQEGLTQHAIATRVFGRRQDFDATVDPIVRIQAGRLRRSLERYYLLSRGGDPVQIELPRGAYVPVVRWRAEGEKAARERRAGQGSADHDGWPSSWCASSKSTVRVRSSRAPFHSSMSSSAWRWAATATCGSCGSAS